MLLNISFQVSNEGKIIDGYLSRMKGIPTSCIEQYAKVNTITVLDLYSQLFDGVCLLNLILLMIIINVLLETIKITL